MTPRAGAAPVVGISLASLALYLLTLQHIHLGDAMAFTARVCHDPLLSERYLATHLFHPHHLLYVPFAMACRAALLALGIPCGDPFLPMQVASALFGAGCVLLVGLIVQRFTVSQGRALVAAAGFALSNATWSYSTEVEVMIPALFFFLLGLWLLWRRPDRLGWATAGPAFAAAVLLHQLMALTVAAVFFALLVARGREWRRSLARLMGLCVGLTVAVYVAVGLTYAGLRTPGGLLDWMLLVRHRSTFGHFTPARALWLGGRTFAESFVSLTPLWRFHDRGPGGWPQRLEAALAILVLVALAVLAAAGAKRWLAALARREPATVSLTLGIAFVSLFNLWFHPPNDDFWAYLPALCWMLSAIHFPEERSRSGGVLPARDAHVLTGARRRSSSWLALALLISLGLGNLAWRAVPSRDVARAPYRDAVDFVHAHLSRGDVLILARGGIPMSENLFALPLLTGVDLLLVPFDDSAGEDERFRREFTAAQTRLVTGGRLFAVEDAVPEVRMVAGTSLQAVPIGPLRDHGVYRLDGVDAGGRP